MTPFRHLLFLQPPATLSGGGRHLTRARELARALNASLSVRSTGREPWTPRSPLEGPWDLLVKVAEAHVSPFLGRLHPGDRRLLHGAPLPVWWMEPLQRSAPGAVLAAVGTGGALGTAGDRRVLRNAWAVARALSARMVVVRPWSLLGESILASPLRGVTRERFRELQREVGAEHREALKRTLDSELPGVAVTVVVRKGSPESVIRHAARHHRARVVVLEGGDGRSLLERVRGTLPERLVRGIPCEVLVARGTPGDPAREGIPSVTIASRPGSGALTT